MTAKEWKTQHDSIGMLTFSRHSVEMLIEAYSETEVEKDKWKGDALSCREQLFALCAQRDRLIAICENINEQAKKDHSERDSLLAVLRRCVQAMERYDKIVGSIHFTHPHLGWSDEDAVAIKAAFSAVRPYLERKEGEK